MYFRQIKQHGDNFSYVVADETTKEAAVIDPSFNAEAISKLAKAQGFRALYVIDTHSHGDHTAGNTEIRSRFNAKIVAHRLAEVGKDMVVKDGDTVRLGNVAIKVIETPGHTPDGICLLVDGKLLTGDTLFVGECGRTDLPGGDAEAMYHSLFDKIAKLNEGIEVYPGHDYGPAPSSTIGHEKMTNYVFQRRSLAEFVEFMRQP
jgi:glyoxylase-like metal-dependent hydrolase (beta-lactamase superfamily II)